KHHYLQNVRKQMNPRENWSDEAIEWLGGCNEAFSCHFPTLLYSILKTGGAARSRAAPTHYPRNRMTTNADKVPQCAFASNSGGGWKYTRAKPGKSKRLGPTQPDNIYFRH